MSVRNRILLVITGGIAAYKCLDLIRRLRESSFAVRVVLTKGAQEFITPLSASALSGEKVYTELFSPDDEAAMGHIQLSRNADLVLVAPATADFMAKMAHGIASDLASTLMLATDKPVMIAPAMNVHMWHHPATQRNLAQLQQDGIRILAPETGTMACGECGEGRLAEVSSIVHAVEQHFSTANAATLQGKHVLITSGPTHEPIDPVRVLANRSSGKQGHALARAAHKAGARVTLVTGPVALPDPEGIAVIHVETAQEMFNAVEKSLPADVAIFAAAVADWRMETASSAKIKKNQGKPPLLRMVENPDILASVSQHSAHRPALVIGFAAETENVLDNAQRKKERKGCDWILANDVSHTSGVFGGAENSVLFLHGTEYETWPKQSKDAVSNKVISKIAEFFSLNGIIST